MPLGLLSCPSVRASRKKPHLPTAPFAPRRAHRRRWGASFSTRPLGAERCPRPVSSTHVRTMRSARTNPKAPAWCAVWPSPTTASASRIPGACAPLEGHLQLPAHHVPTYYPLRIGFEVGAQEGLGFEPSFRISTRRTGTAGKPVEYHTAVSEAISTVRSPLPYQLAISVDSQAVLGSSATAERLGKRPPIMRGLPI
jgi:hypothetical protein